MDRLKDFFIKASIIKLIIFCYIFLFVCIFGLLYIVDSILQIKIFYSAKIIISLILISSVFYLYLNDL